jgi:hypothetical protein
MSEQDVDRALDQARQPSDAEAAGTGLRAAGPCPVKALGRADGAYFYMTPGGELRRLAARDHNTLGLTSVFDGDLAWPRIAFPAFDKDGSPRLGSWSPQAVAAYLMAECSRAGVWDDNLPVRRRGVWRTHDGAPLAHVGDRLWLAGELVGAGQRRPEALYPAGARLDPPAETPAGRDAGRKLLSGLRSAWRWEDPTGPDVVMGWIGVALLGAFPEWRAHIYVTAERGAGKTWLASLVSAALGAQAHAAMNNYTEAGLRQSLTGEARALVLDESEHDESSRVQAVIELLRHMSSGEGARAVRGSAGGSAQTFTVTGCAYLSSILHVPLKPQDRSRIAMVRLAPLSGGSAAGDSQDQARQLIAYASEVSAALRARALARAGFFEQLVTLYRAAFLNRGCDARQADQFATLLAGRDLVTQDRAPDSQALAEEVEAFGHLVDDARAADDEDGEGQLCLTHLYSTAVDVWRSGDRETISELVMAGMQSAGLESRRALGKLGLKLLNVERVDQPTQLAVARNHQALARIFQNTRWERGAWSDALRYLPGAAAADQPHRFQGVKARATLVPEAFLPAREESATEPPRSETGDRGG